MKKVSKNNKVLFSMVVAALILYVFNNMRDYAVVERQSEAVGGELLLFALPFIAYVVYKNIKDTKRAK